MTYEKAIEIIKSECYILDLMSLDHTTMVNQALDLAIQSLQLRILENSFESE